MRGLDYADKLIGKVEAEMEKNPGKAVKEVRIKVGRLLFPDIAELTSAWKLLVQDISLSKAEVVVEMVDGRVCTLSEVVFE